MHDAVSLPRTCRFKQPGSLSPMNREARCQSPRFGDGLIKSENHSVADPDLHYSYSWVNAEFHDASPSCSCIFREVGRFSPRTLTTSQSLGSPFHILFTLPFDLMQSMDLFSADMTMLFFSTFTVSAVLQSHPCVPAHLFKYSNWLHARSSQICDLGSSNSKISIYSTVALHAVILEAALSRVRGT